MPLYAVMVKIVIREDTPEEAECQTGISLRRLEAIDDLFESFEIGSVNLHIPPPKEEPAKSQSKMIEIRGLKEKDRTFHKRFHAGQFHPELNVDLLPGKTIRIFGTYCNKPFDKTFSIGDQAEYDSYNLSYYGPITEISKKSVTIQKMGRSAKRLDLYSFVWRNFEFDLAKVEARNHDEMQYL